MIPKGKQAQMNLWTVGRNQEFYLLKEIIVVDVRAEDGSLEDGVSKVQVNLGGVEFWVYPDALTDLDGQPYDTKFEF